MKSGKKMALYASLGVLLGAATNQAAEDPKVGRETYHGYGHVAKAPEYAEMYVSFQVNCKKSAEEVRQAIEKESGGLWKQIAGKVKTYSETERRYWGDISNIAGSPDSYITQVNSKPVRTRSGATAPGAPVAKRVAVCEDKELPIDAAVSTVYSGTQVLGVRSADLDWVEAVATAMNKKPQGKGKAEVTFSVTPVTYALTQASEREARVEVQEEAREMATGKGSLFESDKQTLKYKSAHFLGRAVANPPQYGSSVGASVERGKAPKVTVNHPFVYTVYSEGSDRIDSSNSQVVDSLSEYSIEGTYVTEADYAQSVVSVSAGCIANKEKAADAISAMASDVQKKLEDFHNRPVIAKVANPETDALTVNNVSSAYASFPYVPVKWKTEADQYGNLPVSEYYDTCSGKTVAAPKSGQAQDLAPYWSVAQSFVVKSSHFEGLLDLVEGLRKVYNVSSSNPGDAVLVANDPEGQVTQETLRRLYLEARQNATACVLDPKSELAKDAKAQGFRCAHLKSIRIGHARPRGHAKSRGMQESGGRAAQAESADFQESAPAPSDLPITIIKKEGELRPRIVVEGWYGFEYQFLSSDYIPDLQGARP